MFVLVALFTWIYHRDRSQRARLWMFGWIAIVIHFGGAAAVAFHAIPPLLSGVIWKGMMIQKVAVNILTTLLGLGGIILACRRSPSMLWLAAAGALAVAPFVISSVTDRYGLPLWAIFLVFGGYLIASIFQPSQGALSGGTSH